MPKFRVAVYRTQTFEHIIEAEDEDDAAMQLISDSDTVEEMMHDHPYDVDHGEWRVDFTEEVEID
jgi:hypothetical protein